MLVRIKRGTYGYKPKGAAIITPIHAGECVEVTAEKAERLAARGVAEIIPEKPNEPVWNHEETAEQASEEERGFTEPDEKSETDLSGRKVSELRALAEDKGIKTGGLRTKAELIEAILAGTETDFSVVGADGE